MLRRRSEFFLFLDNPHVKPEKDGRKPSPYQEYLQVLLHMKMTSTVSRAPTIPALGGVVVRSQTGRFSKCPEINANFVPKDAALFNMVCKSSHFATCWRYSLVTVPPSPERPC